ncbi:thymidine kinase 2, mitochondrial isoform X2 [Nematostella vectensis]|uniref:thymidine kinase 2, mitochondrial isoform X2 n=1 Tax=Nematostella vectensis TaxID=45351 RepID=UPI00138FC668|nr:thymidine kinase 2, mitochondrial isoform X2 [Nematostella vectensis]
MKSCWILGKMLGTNGFTTSPKKALQNGFTRGHDMRKITVAIEGNIGSGKTTLLKYFRQNPIVEILEEPVKKWQNVGGSNILDLMYKDPKRWSYMFESYVLLSMMKLHHNTQKAPVRLLERSAYSAYFCFIENLHRNGLVTSVEYSIFQEWFEFLLEQQKPQLDLIIYLRTSPENCMKRVKMRSRSEESTVSMDLIQNLHERYEDWLIRKTKFHVPAPVVVVDGNQSLAELFEFYDANSQLLLGIKEVEVAE